LSLDRHRPSLQKLGLGIGALALLCAAAPASARNDRPHNERPREILAFHTMYGVDGPFVGDANPIDGIAGDELPWEIRAVNGHLFSNGRLVIVVRGLVFKDDPSVPEDLRGKNDETEFRAAIACLTEEGDAVVPAKVETDGSPADEDGNSLILAKVELPNPCVAPRVFVLAGSEEKWFAVTGFESEEDEE
jgi:hypothetical protein